MEVRSGYVSNFLTILPDLWRDFVVSQHAPNLLLVGVILQARVEMLPPLKQHRVADELEPGGELQSGVGEELLELVRRNVLGGLDLVGAGIEVDVGFDEEDVVDWETTLATV